MPSQQLLAARGTRWSLTFNLGSLRQNTWQLSVGTTSEQAPGHRKYPGTTIVTDSVTSNGLHGYIQERGGKHLRYRRGYKNVISKGVDLNKQGTSCELMMETRHALAGGTCSSCLMRPFCSQNLGWLVEDGQLPQLAVGQGPIFHLQGHGPEQAGHLLQTHDETRQALIITP